MDTVVNLAQNLMGTPGPFAQRLIAAIGIALVTWLVAKLARGGLMRVLVARGVDESLQNPGFSAAMASIAYWLVWLLALPALLGTLGLEGLLAPVNAMMSRLLGFVPNVMGTLVILGAGLLVAQIVRQLATGLLKAAGSERLAERLGLNSALGERGLAGIAGSVVYAFILLPTVAAAFQSLGLEVISAPVSRLLEQVIHLIPRLVSAAVIVAITAVLGRVAAQLVSALAASLGVNRAPAAMGLHTGSRVGGRDVSEWLGTVVMVALLFVGATQASEVMGFAILTNTVAAVGVLLARLAAGGLVLVVGAWLAALAAKGVLATGMTHAVRLALGCRVAVLFFAAALALHQAGLPSEIVSIAFAAVVGSLAVGVAVGLAIALSLGLRPLATRYFEQAWGSKLAAVASSPAATATHGETPPP